MIFLGNVEHSTTPPILQSQTSLQTSASRLCYKDPSGKVEACHRWQLFLPWQSLCVSPVWVRFIQPNILFPSCSMFAFLNGKAPPCPWLWMDDLYVRGCCGHWLVAFGTVLHCRWIKAPNKLFTCPGTKWQPYTSCRVHSHTWANKNKQLIWK